MAQDPFGNQVNLPKFQPPNISSRLMRLVLIALLVLIAASTSFYQVQPEEVGVVLRFGAFVKRSPPGLHFKIPFGIDEVFFVPVQRQLNEEFGFRGLRAVDRRRESSGAAAEEANMLTGDLNAAVVEWVVQYRVTDPFKFLFEVRNIRDSFRDMSEAVMREVVGDRTVNEVLTVGRQEVTSTVAAQLQELCDQYSTGITVDQVVLQDVTPPDPVKPAFNEVNQAQQEREKLINEAQSEYNKVVPRARGEAEQTIRAAEGYALDRVNRARGDAARFTTLYNEYRKAPEVTRKRIYLETMDQVLPKLGRKIIVDEDLKGVLPLISLDGQQTLPAPRRPEQGGQ